MILKKPVLFKVIVRALDDRCDNIHLKTKGPKHMMSSPNRLLKITSRRSMIRSFSAPSYHSALCLSLCRYVISDSTWAKKRLRDRNVRILNIPHAERHRFIQLQIAFVTLLIPRLSSRDVIFCIVNAVFLPCHCVVSCVQP